MQGADRGRDLGLMDYHVIDVGGKHAERGWWRWDQNLTILLAFYNCILPLSIRQSSSSSILFGPLSSLNIRIHNFDSLYLRTIIIECRMPPLI